MKTEEKELWGSVKSACHAAAADDDDLYIQDIEKLMKIKRTETEIHRRYWT